MDNSGLADGGVIVDLQNLFPIRCQAKRRYDGALMQNACVAVKMAGAAHFGGLNSDVVT
ncbi:hypothetical protein D3C85_1692280 [compost metagenome]